jgi:hypothetical protein
MNTQLYINSGIGSLYFHPQYTPRQHYAGGGIATLVPRQGYLFGGITRAIGNVLGSVADVAKDVVSSPIGQVGLSILAPGLGLPMWASPLLNAGMQYASTGKINPLGLLASSIPGLQFTGGQGLESLIPTGYGNILGQGTTLSDLFTGQVGNLFSPNADTSGGVFNNMQPGQNISNINTVQQLGIGNNTLTPTQDYLSSINPYTADPYTGTSLSLSPDLNQPLIGADQLTYNPATGQQFGRTAQELESSLVTGGGDVGSGRSTKELLSTYGRQPGTEPGVFDNLKTIASPSSNVGVSERLDALQNVGSDAFKAIFYKKGGTELDKTAVLATLITLPTYFQAKSKADEIGIPFSEVDYQAGKVSPTKEKYASLAPKSAFGLKDGGRIEFGLGGMSDNRISQIIQLIRDAESVGDIEKANELRLDLYRETKKADGGRIGFESGKLALPKDKEGPANKATRLQMEKAIKEIEKEQAQRRIQEQLMNKNYDEQSMYDFKKTQKELFDMAPQEGYPPLPEPVKPEGVLSIKLTPVQEKAYGGMINHPVRMLHGGMSELDLRAKGGFIPVGIKERADDVPAMLSKNEFVFTADAVRNAGGGSINKGAQKMYKLMKSLENKKVKMRAN